MNKQKYYPIETKATYSTDNIYEVAVLSLIDRVEIGLLTVEKQDGRYWVTYSVNYPEKLQNEVIKTLKEYQKSKLLVNVRRLRSKLNYLWNLHHKKIKDYQLNKERNDSK